MEHGHALLMKALEQRRPDWLERRGIRMLEVGTTREPVPQQDSTRALAEFCVDHGWQFTTCDMDHRNTERAVELFDSMGTDFVAVTAKGEEFLAQHRRAFDVVYLDAYDFDHGKHSEVRQQRYEQILGSRIDQAACELMHLQSMQRLNHAGRRGCLVVIDDTWRETPDGPWLGKGPLAVPWALKNGWSLTVDDPDYRAVVLELDPTYYALNRRLTRVAQRSRRRWRRFRRAQRKARDQG
jgi:hypothetical protein